MFFFYLVFCSFIYAGSQLFIASDSQDRSSQREAVWIETANSPYPYGDNEKDLNKIHAARFATRTAYLQMRSLFRALNYIDLLDFENLNKEEEDFFINGILVLKPSYESQFVSVNLVYQMFFNDDQLSQIDQFCQKHSITLQYVDDPGDYWSYPQYELQKKHWLLINRFYQHFPYEQ